MENLYKVIAVIICDLPFATPTLQHNARERERIAELLKPGDIILSSDRLYPLWNILVRIITGSRYSHSAIVVSKRDVVESFSFGFGRGSVICNPIDRHLNGYKSFCIVRPKYQNEEALRSSVSFAYKQVGKPYNFSMRPANGDSYFCTELVGEVLKHSGIDAPKKTCCFGEGVTPDTFRKLDDIGLIFENRRWQTSTALRLLSGIWLPALTTLLLVTVAGISLTKATLISFLTAFMLGYTQHLLLHRKLKKIAISVKAFFMIEQWREIKESPQGGELVIVQPYSKNKN